MALKKCPGCGKQYEGDMKFCTRCGKKLEDVETIIQGNSETSGNDVMQKNDAGTENETPPVNSGVKAGIKPGRGRVIKLVGKTVTLGMTDGTVEEVPSTALGFKVKIGDELDIYQDNGKVIYIKVDKVITVEKSKRSYNRLVYLLLALIFGPTGVHNLYAGNITLGVVWLIIFIILLLLTLFIAFLGFITLPAIFFMWVIAVIQGIIGLFRSSDGN